MKNVLELLKVRSSSTQTQPVVLSNNAVVMVEFPDKVHTVDQASQALQAPFEDEMQAVIDAKLLREQIAAAEEVLSQLELDRELATKHFKLMEKMVSASGFRPVRPSPQEGIYLPYAVEENPAKGVLIASVNGLKGSNVFVSGRAGSQSKQ